MSKEAKELYELAMLPPPIPRPKKPKKMYVFVLDFTNGKVYRYNVKDKIDNPLVDFENFIIEAGHSLSNVEWMTTNNGKLHTYMDN